MLDVNKAAPPSIDEVVAASRVAGMSYGKFVAAGLPVPEGILKKPQRQQRRSVDPDLFGKLYWAGYTDAAIAEQLGVAPSSITKYRVRHGLRPNRRSRG